MQTVHELSGYKSVLTHSIFFCQKILFSMNNKAGHRRIESHPLQQGLAEIRAICTEVDSSIDFSTSSLSDEHCQKLYLPAVKMHNP